MLKNYYLCSTQEEITCENVKNTYSYKRFFEKMSHSAKKLARRTVHARKPPIPCEKK